MIFPPAIIFVNNDLSDQVKSVLVANLYITEIMSDVEFDLRVTNDHNYPTIVHQQNKRIIVIRNTFQDLTNRNLADVVMFIKAGLCSIEKSNYGPPGLTLPVENLYIHELLRYNNLIT